MPAEILIIDDEADIRSLISGVLMDEGYHTRAAGDAAAALEAVRSRRPALVLLDIWLEGSALDGMQLLEILKAEYPNLPVIMISGHGTVEMAVSAIKQGAYDFIEKPFKSDRLLVLIERAIEAARLKRENEELLVRAGGVLELVGTSHAISQIKQLVDRVARTSSRVLINGPAGVGKEVVARLIHAKSPRADSPFVVLNCATMHPDRMEQELFGLAGTDDNGSGKAGTLEQAHGGTLLLDEVADMPFETQGKFVRVMQEQSFERVGGATAVQVDVRVVATTSKNLEEEIAAGRFREDLYYRLRVVPIDVPSLKDRPTDIPELADYFMNTTAARAGTTPKAFSEDAIAAMQAYHWPGNVRQLCNVIDWLLIMAPVDSDEPITTGMLPPEITGTETALPRWEKGSEIMALPLREARERFEREYLAAQVSRFGGNISRTAEFIGMERSALHRKLKALGVHGAERADGETAA